MNKKGPWLIALAVMLGLAILSGVLLNVWGWETIRQETMRSWHFFSDKEQITSFIESFGWGAPFIFMGFQFLQVLLAPIPGEATGFLGGYLFGALKGFCYSSIALTLGSVANFYLGRLFGKRLVRKFIPKQMMQRFDTLLKRQGVFILFLLFVFPGFPKDYLCLFLGVSRLPFTAFIFICAIGRIPGTLMLSIQGSSIYHARYMVFAILCVVGVVLAVGAFYYRERLYRWIDQINARDSE